MILFHGSNIEINEIDLDKSKPYKDFGKGFYLSDVENQALEMANFKSLILGGKPVVTKFEFDKTGLLSSSLKIKVFERYSDEWLDFVIQNRDGKAIKEYDYVYGPIANDKVGLQLRKFKDRNITKQELLERLKYYKGITYQYFFGSYEALRFLKLL